MTLSNAEAKSRRDRKEEEQRRWLETHTPTCCPRCGGKNTVNHIVTWFAHSLEPQDLHNTAELVEHQCQDCAISFWL